MAIENPPPYLQGGSYPALNDRRVLEYIYNIPNRGGDQEGGVFTTSDLAVSERAGTANMSVDIAAGSAIIAGTENATQAAYMVHNSVSAVNLAIGAADGTNARYDLVVASVKDAAYSGADNEWELAIVAGTAAASPVYPAVPANSITLAVVTVGAGVTTIVDANITDCRALKLTNSVTVGQNGYLSAHGGRMLVNSAHRPANPYIGMQIREQDTEICYYYDGVGWKQENGKWISFTPTPYNCAFTTTLARYTRLEDLIIAQYKLTLTASPTGVVEIGLPVAPHTNTDFFSGSAVGVDISTGFFHSAQMELLGPPSERVGFWVADGTASAWNATTPFTWVSSDIITFQITYEAA